MSLRKPRALRPGATIAVVSPASAAKADRVHSGVARLEALGCRALVMRHALARGPLYYAGTAAERAADLTAAFSDPKVDAVLCTRGGWGSAELLPLLDANLIRANPKIFAGYSDHTSLHIWLQREAHLVTFHAPMIAADFSRTDGVELASWNHAVSGDTAWSLDASDGLRILRPGFADGVIAGGCIAILAESLGTPYAMLPASQGEPRILFLEDIGVKPYQWDRMLLHLRYAGLLENVSGVVFGDMQQCVAAEENALLEQAILHALRDFAGPIAIGLRSGHVDAANVTLPFGIRARLDLGAPDAPRLDFLEAATI